jgi:hypothetical protein
MLRIHPLSPSERFLGAALLINAATSTSLRSDERLANKEDHEGNIVP